MTPLAGLAGQAGRLPRAPAAVAKRADGRLGSAAGGPTTCNHHRPIRSPESHKAELAARRSGDKAKLKKVLKAREEEKARTLAAFVRAAKGNHLELGFIGRHRRDPVVLLTIHDTLDCDSSELVVFKQCPRDLLNIVPIELKQLFRFPLLVTNDLSRAPTGKIAREAKRTNIVNASRSSAITRIKQRFGHRSSKRDFYRPLQGAIIRAGAAAKKFATSDVAGTVVCGQNRGELNFYPQTIGYDGMPRLVVR